MDTKVISNNRGKIIFNPGSVKYFPCRRVLLAQGKQKEGLARLEKALSLQPNYLDALYLIAAVQVSQKENQKAIDRVEAQIKISPQNPFFYNMLGGLYEMNKKLDKAEGSFLKAVEINPNIPQFYNSLAGFYLRRKNVDKAISEFRNALDKNPNSLSANSEETLSSSAFLAWSSDCSGVTVVVSSVFIVSC